jgi:hypothetical protein
MLSLRFSFSTVLHRSTPTLHEAAAAGIFTASLARSCLRQFFGEGGGGTFAIDGFCFATFSLPWPDRTPFSCHWAVKNFPGKHWRIRTTEHIHIRGLAFSFLNFSVPIGKAIFANFRLKFRVKD